MIGGSNPASRHVRSILSRIAAFAMCVQFHVSGPLDAIATHLVRNYLRSRASRCDTRRSRVLAVVAAQGSFLGARSPCR